MKGAFNYTLFMCILLLLIFFGCSNINVATYDVNEYAIINKIITKSELQDCSKEGITEIYQDSLELKNYSQYLPRNEKTKQMTQNLYIIAEGLYKNSNFNLNFCKDKLNNLMGTAEDIQKSVGNKPR